MTVNQMIFWRLSSQISFETQKRQLYEKLEEALEMRDLE